MTYPVALPPATLHARVVVDELIRNGMREAVLCPGSRSTPLAFALADAESAGRIALHVRVDERSAAFLALGLSAASDAPVAVVCTSGSAVANFHPAAVEARFNHRRVVFLTANRPPEMEGVGAQQTIVQRGIFAHDVVSELVMTPAGPEINSEEDSLGWNAHWRSALCRIMTQSAISAGPIHIDVPFREPLVPPTESPAVSPAVLPLLPAPWQGRRDGQPWTQYVPNYTLDLSRRTVVIAGQGSWEIPALAGVPTFCEPGGRTLGTIFNPLTPPALMSNSFTAPEQVVVVGKPTLHRSVTRLLADPSLTQIVVTAATSPTEWADVSGNATIAATSLTRTGECPQQWLAACAEVDGAARSHVLEVVAELRAEETASSAAPTTSSVSSVSAECAPVELPCGVDVVYAVGEVVAADPRMLLFVGSSNPVRDISLTHPELGPRCWVNRGASGIDGNISTASGLALHHSGPVIAFLGDLAAVHDSGGLLIPTLETAPRNLTIVVANDDGGGIFATLEQGAPAYATQFERLFGVPHGVNFASLAAGWGVEYRQCTVAELPTAIGEYAQHDSTYSQCEGTCPHDNLRPGVRFIEVRTQRQHRHELAATLSGWLGRPDQSGR